MLRGFHITWLLRKMAVCCPWCGVCAVWFCVCSSLFGEFPFWACLCVVFGVGALGVDGMGVLFTSILSRHGVSCVWGWTAFNICSRWVWFGLFRGYFTPFGHLGHPLATSSRSETVSPGSVGVCGLTCALLSFCFLGVGVVGCICFPSLL